MARCEKYDGSTSTVLTAARHVYVGRASFELLLGFPSPPKVKKMVATGAGTRVGVTLKLSQLQNLCKRDPSSYQSDYDAQVRRLESELSIQALQPSKEPSTSLSELIQFVAAVSSSSYKGLESDKVANLLMTTLVGEDSLTSTAFDGSSTSSIPALYLHKEVRKSCVSALILMRNKGALPPLKLLHLFFTLMSAVPDKALREVLYRHMVNDVKNINKKGKRDESVNRSVQSFLHKVVNASQSDDEGVASKFATDLTCELYRRKVWTDERSVAIVASAVASSNQTVMSRSIRFFLNIEEKMAQDAKREQDDEWQEKSVIDYHLHSRKTASRQRHVKRQLKIRQKAKSKLEQRSDDWMDVNPNDDAGVEASKKLFPAIELLRDPQGLAESVFKRLRSCQYKYEIRLLMLNFVTRLVGNHGLVLLPVYPFLQKYMGGHQRNVTAVLAYAVQACHEEIPPEDIFGMLKTIAYNFITERCSEEQMAVGINAARAICCRVPSVLVSDDMNSASSIDIEAFTRDIAAYGNHRDRSVSIAGKSWTNLIREVHPSLLQGKHRGVQGSALHRAGVMPLKFGEKRVATGVEGAELLVEYEANKAAKQRMDHGNETDDEDDDVRSNDEDMQQISQLSGKERDKLKQEVSSTRIFSSSDFAKMRKLVDREKRMLRDPRELARRKRAIARGESFVELSDDESDGSDDEALQVTGVVNPEDIMALAKRKRQSKAEKLEKIIAGRTLFETKQRDGGATNNEKKRTKNFMMSKYSRDNRKKGSGKTALNSKRTSKAYGHDARKRRRKM